ncbi:Flp pilus assembly protein CpaB [Stenotrophomonas maltophilia]|uniref:Flp pilus assembly protein CpaB n=1 Tax=Stenotrophomonas maltophilia group TaxID=995085 RepID=UPI0015DE0001|nr:MULTISPECIES: Flp pilus assembly protein CpaB [Stenotrophomonas maltophilia group]MBA0273235.1 Flp pilus assembly protein CpaB [Stenotrophomonas maltophilia]MDT3492116.1 Flp pilus assembly protein CpaB [Stenotrophomonas maltophilia group sp. msm4]
MLKLTRIAAVALIGLAVLLALIALMIGRKPAAPATVAPVAHNETQAITVVEAVARLPAGEPISANGLRLAQRTAPVPGAATSIAAVTGKVPVQDIAEGSVINGSALAQGFSLQLRPGERALAVPVDELVGAGNRILPGDFVDVFLNLRNAQPSINSPGEAAQTRLLLSRLRVLSYGQQDIVPLATETISDSEADTRNDPRAADITGSGSTHSSSNEAPQPARSAVLAVPVADANRLLLGAQQGKLFLALRNPADTGLPDLALFPQSRGVIDPLRGLDAEQQLALQRPENHAFAGIDSDALAGRGSAPPRSTPDAPARAPASRRSAPRASGIEIIRGDSSASRASL